MPYLGLSASDAAMECPGSSVSALRRAALVVAETSAISITVRLANDASTQMREETVDESAIVYPTGERAEARY